MLSKAYTEKCKVQQTCVMHLSLRSTAALQLALLQIALLSPEDSMLLLNRNLSLHAKAQCSYQGIVPFSCRYCTYSRSRLLSKLHTV